MLETLRASQLLAIIRLRDTHAPDTLVRALDALAAGGVRLAEITIDTPAALMALQQYHDRAPAERPLQLGVGTLTQAEQVAAVVASGASFVVTPVCVPEVVTAAKDQGLEVLCGALTPTEIFTAFAAGADAVKVFPAASVGAGYFRQVAAPLPHIPLVAVGGVSAQSAPDYLTAGAVAVAVGSALVSDDLLTRHAWDELTARSAQLIASMQESSQTNQNNNQKTTNQKDTNQKDNGASA